VTFGLTAAALFKLTHPAGLRTTSLLPHAFDATSPTESGALSLVLLVLAVALGFAGLKVRPRSWALVGSAGAMSITSLALVTVTLVATEENPSPPDGARLVPYALPLAVALLGLGIAGRGARLYLAEGATRKIAAFPVAMIGGALAFLAFEMSALISLFQ
jgi:hypothetical protein